MEDKVRVEVFEANNFLAEFFGSAPEVEGGTCTFASGPDESGFTLALTVDYDGAKVITSYGITEGKQTVRVLNYLRALQVQDKGLYVAFTFDSFDSKGGEQVKRILKVYIKPTIKLIWV